MPSLTTAGASVNDQIRSTLKSAHPPCGIEVLAELDCLFAFQGPDMDEGNV
jgi:hypothetical protein